MTLSRGKRFKAAAIAAAGLPILEAAGATYEWREDGLEHLARVAREGTPPIYVWWHGRTLAGILYLRDRQIVGIASDNFDGEWIARIITKLGFRTARGSSSRGGVKALAKMRRALVDGSPVALTIDGPRGPAKVAQPGAIWLAGATGSPLIPLHMEATKFWTVKSWDRHQIPKPGAAIAIAIGAPIFVPDTEEASIAAGQTAVEDALGRLETKALAMAKRT